VKIGVFGLLRFGTPETIIPKAAKAGFECFETELNPLQYDKGSARKLREIVESNGVVISSISHMPYFGQPSPVNRERELIVAKAVMELSVEVGAKYVRNGIGYMPSIAPGASFDDVYRWGVEGTRRSTKIAEDLGVTLVFDNFYFTTVLENLAVVKEINSPNLKMSVDIGNCVAHGEDLLASIRACGDLLVNGHLKEPKIFGSKSLPGFPGPYLWGDETGDGIGTGKLIDWEAYLKVLKEIKFKGYQSIECKTWEHATNGLKYLTPLCKKIGI